MARRKTVSIVTHNPSHGLVWQRLWLPLMELRDEYEFKSYTAADFSPADAFNTDCVVMCQPWAKGYLNIVERCRLNHHIPVICDIDDLISELPSDHPDYATFTNHCLPQIIQAASHVVYATKFLSTRLGHLNRNHSVIPNSISCRTFKDHKPLPKPHKNGFIVGWTGGQSHRSDQLYTFVDDLRVFLRRHNDAKAYFHVLCPDVLLKEFGSQIIYDPNPCDYLDYYAVASNYPFDVCLVGLQDNNFNNAKSDLKLLEMAPHNIVLIASPRGDFIQHEERGVMLYADEQPGAWLEQLEWAYSNRQELQVIGDIARDYVLKERTSDHAAKQWLEVLKQYV